MSTAKVIEISAASPESFEEAINNGLQEAAKSVRNIQGAWIKEQKVTTDGGQVKEYRVDLKVTFLVEQT